MPTALTVTSQGSPLFRLHIVWSTKIGDDLRTS